MSGSSSNNSTLVTKQRRTKAKAAALLPRWKVIPISLAVALLYTAVCITKTYHDMQRSGFTTSSEEFNQPSTPLPGLNKPDNHGSHVEEATFNGFPLHKVNSRPKSQVHCVGENFQSSRSWLFRSCRFETFCFDPKLKDFVVYPERPLNASTRQGVWTSTHSSKKLTHVAAGAQSKSWFPVLAVPRYGIKSPIGEYRPKIVYEDDERVPTSYYQLNATWIPFFRHERSPFNPGHLIWDDFLGIYSLLDIFDQTDDTLILTHMMRPAVRDKNATFDFDGDIPPPKRDLIKKFLPLLGTHNYSLQTLQGRYKLRLGGETNHGKDNTHGGGRRSVICANTGLLGSGLFSDHGDHHWHGQTATDYQYPHNHGRGGQFRRYRRWLMEHIGVEPNTPIQVDPFFIVVSHSSSTKGGRSNVTFDRQIDALTKGVGDRAVVKSVQLSKLSLVAQATLLSRTAILVSVVGGGTVTGTFLPKGASVVLYTAGSTFLDWDFWNNFPQVKVHWMATNLTAMDDELHLNALVDIVKRQLDYLETH